VFHVYDRLHLDRVPRRYTVEAGKELAGEWTTSSDYGQYDLWVLGPNGFHRHFTGSIVANGRKPAPEIAVSYDKRACGLIVKLINRGNVPCVFTLKANAYKLIDLPWRQLVVPHGQSTAYLPLLLQGKWYDFTARVEGDALFTRRFAGRMEDGAPSVSDPAMGDFGQA